MTDRELNIFVSRMWKAGYSPEKAFKKLQEFGITSEQMERIKDLPYED